MAPSDLNFLHTSCPFVPRCRSSPVLGQLRGARLVQVPPQFPAFLLLNPQTCSQLLFFLFCALLTGTRGCVWGRLLRGALCKRAAGPRTQHKARTVPASPTFCYFPCCQEAFGWRWNNKPVCGDTRPFVKPAEKGF